MLRQRQRKASKSSSSSNNPPLSPATATIIMMDTSKGDDGDDDPSRPLLAHGLPPSSSYSSITLVDQDNVDATTVVQEDMDLSKQSRKSQWIILAVASGACAAFNGVFAKLTTTELTTSFATSIANLLGLGNGEKVVEVIIRAMFFGLNLIFNGVMWTLFTKALARGTSTVQVSIINTSSNFMITAILGFFIFTESLPPLWWLGAAMLVAGNVIIGRREEKDESIDEHMAAENGEGAYAEEDEGLLADSVELDEDVKDVASAVTRTQEEDDALMLDLDGDKSEDELI